MKWVEKRSFWFGWKMPEQVFELFNTDDAGEITGRPFPHVFVFKNHNAPSYSAYRGVGFWGEFSTLQEAKDYVVAKLISQRMEGK